MRCIIFLFILSQTAGAQLFPSATTNNWSRDGYTGVVGGIPAVSTIFSNIPSGLSDAGIQSAVSACPSNQVIKFPTGTWNITNGITVPDDIVIRGSGSNTVFVYWGSSGACFAVGLDYDYLWNSPAAPNNKILFGYSQGSSNLLVNAAGPIVGRLLQISQLNDINLPVIHSYGYQNVRRQMVRVTAVSNATNITIWPPIIWPLATNLVPVYAMSSQQRRGVGLEDFMIDASHSVSTTAHINIQQSYNSWCRNIKIRLCKNYAFGFADNVNCAMTYCWADQSSDGPVSNHAGLLMGTSSACLIENNILDNIFPNCEINGGSCGNVFAYNFCNANYYGASMLGNHGAHNSFNLYEGNIACNYQSDSYFGSASEETLFRNWFHNLIPYTTTNHDNGSGIWSIKINRFNRNYNIVGNVLGNTVSNQTYYGLYALGKPNIGNENWGAGLLADQQGFGPPWGVKERYGSAITINQSGTTVTASSPFFGATNAPDPTYWPLGWILQDRTTGAAKFITAFSSSTVVTVSDSVSATGDSFEIFPGPGGWQELDTNVQATANIKGNFYLVTAAADSPGLQWPTNSLATMDAPLGGDIIPDSLFSPSTPVYFSTANMTWPPIGVSRTNGLSATSIPAGYAWVNGYWPTNLAQIPYYPARPSGGVIGR